MTPNQIAAIRAVSKILQYNVTVPERLLTHNAKETLRVYRLVETRPIEAATLALKYQATYGKPLASTERLSKHKVGTLLTQLVHAGVRIEKSEGKWRTLS